VKVDYHLTASGSGLVAEALQAESSGYQGAFVGEIAHDPFVALALPAAATSSIQLGTCIALAFARNPMTTAIAANDLQLLSNGRLVLGLGSQIKAHVTRRFSMPWSRPAARMREFILAMRAIWAPWNDGERLDFVGEFYSHTLMPPFFNPGQNPYGPPAVALAAVGTRMTEVAGEVADALLCHGFTTERYLRTVTLPAVTRGRERAQSPRRVDICIAPFVVTGTNESEFTAAATAVRNQVAFYASTPAYRGVLEAHGWGDLQTELLAMTKADRWSEMGSLIDDEILDAFAVVGQPAEVGPMLAERFGDVADRVSLYVPYDPGTALEPVISYLLAADGRKDGASAASAPSGAA